MSHAQIQRVVSCQPLSAELIEGKLIASPLLRVTSAMMSQLPLTFVCRDLQSIFAHFCICLQVNTWGS